MKWWAFVGCWVLAVLVALGCFGCAVSGIWLDSNHLKDTAVMCVFADLVLGFVIAGLYDADATKRSRLPRDMRKHLKRREAQMELDRRIKAMEQEAGIE